MFPSSRFRLIACPLQKCSSAFCHFSHNIVSPSTQTNQSYKSVGSQTIQTNSLKRHIKPQHVEQSNKKLKSIVEPLKNDHIPKPTQKHILSVKMISSDPPNVQPSLTSKVSKDLRQKAVNIFFKQFKRIYINIQSPLLAHEHAIKQEEQLLNMANENTYSTFKFSIYRSLCCRLVSKSEHDVGIDGEYKNNWLEIIGIDIGSG
jgi:hypothetical protein